MARRHISFNVTNDEFDKIISQLVPFFRVKYSPLKVSPHVACKIVVLEYLTQWIKEQTEQGTVDMKTVFEKSEVA